MNLLTQEKMMSKNKWLFLIFTVLLWCHEMKAFSEKAVSFDSLYPTIEEILNEDLPTSLCIYNRLIEKHEASQCYDEIYVQALHRILYPYSLVDQNRAINTLRKLEIYDKNLPKWKVENGYLIADEIPFCVGEVEKWWFTKMSLGLGLCESEEDIEFSNEQIKIKLKPCCCRRKPQNLD